MHIGYFHTSVVMAMHFAKYGEGRSAPYTGDPSQHREALAEAGRRYEMLGSKEELSKPSCVYFGP